MRKFTKEEMRFIRTAKGLLFSALVQDDRTADKAPLEIALKRAFFALALSDVPADLKKSRQADLEKVALSVFALEQEKLSEARAKKAAALVKRYGELWKRPENAPIFQSAMATAQALGAKWDFGRNGIIEVYIPQASAPLKFSPIVNKAETSNALLEAPGVDAELKAEIDAEAEAEAEAEIESYIYAEEQAELVRA